MIQIVFDNNGKARWFKVPDEVKAKTLDHATPFTESDLDWFRRPLSKTREE